MTVFSIFSLAILNLKVCYSSSMYLIAWFRFRFKFLFVVILFGFGCVRAQNPEASAIATSTFDSLMSAASQQIRNTSYDSSLVSLTLGLKLATAEANMRWKAQATSKLAELYIYKGSYPDAISMVHSGLSMYEGLGDSVGVAECLNNLASIFYYQQEYERAKEHYLKSLSIRQFGKDKRALANNYNNLGSVYSKLNEPSKALEYHQKSLILWNELESVSGRAITLDHMGSCYQQIGDLKKALSLHLESHHILESAEGHKRTAISVEAAIGGLYIDLGQNEKAVKWCKMAYLKAKDINVIQEVQKSCLCLFKAYKALGEPAKALENYQRYVEMKDSIFGLEKIKDVTRLEMSYAFDKQQLADSLRFESEKQLQQERIQRQRIGLVSIGSMLLLSAFLALAIFQGKRKSEMLLLNILPRKTAEELKSKGHAEPKFYESASVLFTDFVGFTAISEQLSPQELVNEINECFSAFDRICDKHNIEKIKTIGDAYMAVGGVPELNEAHASSVVKAGIEMQQVISEIAMEKKKLGKPFFRCRIGIHSGPLVAGIVGIKKFQYDIWGDTVNIASRMESGGAEGKVNISESTYLLVKDLFHCDYRGEIEAKGKGKVKMYFVFDKA